ncbi:MAG: hypothetical protein K9I34_06330 [Bacteroidales bacterium]|nr:hypothetical protein [Bacteroidales bacterium]
MKAVIYLFLIPLSLIFIPSCAQEVKNEKACAQIGDQVWIVKNVVQLDKAAQFENYCMEILAPAAEKMNPAGKSSVRLMKAETVFPYHTINYYFVMDPVIQDVNYDMFVALEGAYGTEKAKEYYQSYLDCLSQENPSMEVVTVINW